jgi:hypothetical protein
MSPRATSVVIPAFLAICGWAGLSYAAENDDMLRWIPQATNSVAIVRVKQLLESPLGRKEKWSQQQRDGYAAGVTSTPPGVEEIVRATEVRTAGAAAATTFTVYRTIQESMVRSIARRDSATIDKVGDTVAVRSARGPYFVQLAPKLMGAVEPADRQVLSRWIRDGLKAPPVPSDSFLHKAVRADEADQVIVAVDLSDMLDPESVAQWIKSLPKQNQFGNVNELAGLFASIRGIRMSVKVTDKVACQLQLSFGQPVGPNGPGVEQCVMAWLDEVGGRIDQFNAPEVTAKGNTVTLQSPLDQEGFRRLISLIRSPHDDFEHESPAVGTNKPADGIASRRYFQAVSQYLENLDRQNRKASDYNRTALWHENFANKVDEQSLAGVDADLAAWGKSVSDNLRALANSLRGTPVEINKLDRKVRVHTQMNMYRYASTPYADLYRPGTVNINSNLSDVRAAQAEAVEDGNDKRDEIWQMLYDDKAAIEKKMEDRYKIGFAKPK